MPEARFLLAKHGRDQVVLLFCVYGRLRLMDRVSLRVSNSLRILEKRKNTEINTYVIPASAVGGRYAIKVSVFRSSQK